MAGKRNLPLLVLTQNLFSPATTTLYRAPPMLLQQPSCRLQYATIGLQMLILEIALCHNQIADALVMKREREKRPYETTLAQWR
jgi:hypothetical protein